MACPQARGVRVFITGFRLKLPPPNEYRVQSGDTVNSIAQLYDVSASQLVRLNNLSAPYRLQLGQVLRLPTPTMRQEAVVRSAPENINQDDEGQTFTTARVNPVLREGVEPTVNRSTNTDNNNVVVPNKKPAVQKNQPARVQQASTVTRAKIPSTTPKASGSGKYMRPVSGRIISSYGPKADGLHNDGINIKAARGAPVRAAENGVVVYAGDDLEGYGNLILIRHEGKMMTAYAHLDKMLAKRGATVTRGQSIGTVGSTGQVDSPQLHFEVRKGSKPLNPGKYL